MADDLTLEQKIALIDTSKDNIKTAIVNKGVTPTGNITTYAAAINNISTANISSLSITPTTSAQTITATGGVDGYSPINVSAVTSAIDSDIVAGNIKQGVNILGVNGSLVGLNGETRSVSLTSSSGQTFTPTSGKNGITSITVTPTNRAFSSSISPTTSAQTFSIPSGNSGNGSFTVGAVTSAIDSNIAAGNIRSGVSILGVTGNYSGSTINNQNKTVYTNGEYTADEGYTGLGTVTVAVNNVNNTNLSVTPTTSQQSFTAASPYTGYGTVTVGKVDSSIDSNIAAGNIKKGVNILGVTGTYEGSGTSTGGLAIKMSSNGTMGGNFFAVSSTDDANPYVLFDNDPSTSATFSMSLNLLLYSPIGLVITHLDALTGGGYSISDGGTIKGSNDNSTWTNISFTGTALDKIEGGLDLVNSTPYKYYKFETLPLVKKSVSALEITGYFE